ncbi:hypothetical protein I5M27_12015 [Adhaeribacter sp. BT258]|uniref:DUF2116 family Zn-ribbon domain-containing protein n=1 Tax=Adhaeribacter terrigena TaxID=2793070 RepID=A0ABS1C3J0_9BACT|nr:hypothetical protein [Adhaeribacter terrigena]MBK0403716.1 hypothetical protein [Adhaeribacter terrigena]
MEKEHRKCAQCSNILIGRSDKRFCSEQCRSECHNHKKLQNTSEKKILQVNAILRKNRSILKMASPQGKTTVPRQILELAGFNFTYFTNLYRTNRGNTYYFCYDYGYLLLPEDKILIVNQQAYMAT